MLLDQMALSKGYQTSTGAYIIDEINLTKDDLVNPIILIKEKIYRGNII